jgi:predicted nucleic acid-binding protein
LLGLPPTVRTTTVSSKGQVTIPAALVRLSPAADPRCAVLLPVVAAAQAGTGDLMISTVTVTELLTAPLRDGNREAEAAARLFMGLLCTVVPVDLAVAERAAALRTEHGLRTPDALICATALGSAAVVVGNDLRWKHAGLPSR